MNAPDNRKWSPADLRGARVPFRPSIYTLARIPLFVAPSVVSVSMDKGVIEGHEQTW